MGKVKIGRGKNVIFYGDVKIGAGSMIQDNVIIGSGSGGSESGKVEIGNAIIRSGTVIYSDIKIGKDFKTGHNVLIREKTEIGNDVLIGTNSVIDGNCKIGNNVIAQTNVYRNSSEGGIKMYLPSEKELKEGVGFEHKGIRSFP